jgi:ferritin-like metal-binding protein YciE
MGKHCGSLHGMIRARRWRPFLKDRTLTAILFPQEKRKEIRHERKKEMPMKNTKEVFVLLLTNIRNATQRESTIYQEMAQLVQDADIKEALDARVFLTDKNLSAIDECFRLINEQPLKTTGRLHDVLVEEFRRELSDIQSPVARHLFILAKVQQLIHFRIGEFVALIAAADMTGDFAVGVLLESCLADKVAFAERTRRLIKHVIESKAAAKLAA